LTVFVLLGNVVTQ